jgi:DNA-directed RNA polymerase subunit D
VVIRRANLRIDAENMQIEVLSRDKDSIRFLLKGVSPAFSNALRRAMIAEVPTMAIEDVMIIENSSVLYDEILSHRLGLVPLTTDLDSYVLPEECSCKSELGCNRCRATLSLEAEATDESRYVYSGEMKPENPEVKPVSDTIPIAKLAPGQRIKLEAYAKLGRGAEHAKWQPVSSAAYKYLPKLSIDPKKCNGCAECVKFCPKSILAIKNGKVTVEREIDCSLCRECERRCPQKPPAIRVGWDVSTFVFAVESTGALPPARIVKEAARILSKKAIEMRKILEEG